MRARFQLIRTSLSNYQEHPIFLHAVNRELHDAVGKPVNAGDLLHAIRIFSIVSCQKMFCNVSQVHEIFFDQPDALRELAELSRIGRFIAHSDYGSFDEFRESRLIKFSHSKIQHPAFFDTPSKELLELPHDSMGISVSTTGHIEKNLVEWLDSNPNSSLFRTLSQNDAKNLRESEKWIAETLRNRDQKALTFDVFSQTAGGVFLKSAEGAVRRSLTETYIDSYLASFDPHCIWGFRGINHFERMKLLAGLHYRFARAVLYGTGIDETLNRVSPSDYGQLVRLLSEQSEAVAFFRLCYAELALVIDSQIADETAWHKCDAKVTASIQKIRQSSVLKPSRECHSYEDVLLNAGESVNRAKCLLKGSSQNLIQQPKQYPVLTIKDKPTEALHEQDQRSSKEPTENDKQPFWANYAVLVIIGGIASAVGVYFLLPEFFVWGFGLRLGVSIGAGLISGAIIYWFHPDNFLRRVALGGLMISTVGGISYRFKVFGIQALGDSIFEIENAFSNILIGGGFFVFFVSIVLDTYTRSRKLL